AGNSSRPPSTAGSATASARPPARWRLRTAVGIAAAGRYATWRRLTTGSSTTSASGAPKSWQRSTMAAEARTPEMRSEITVGGARLSFREEGAGCPVVLIHATTSTGEQWHSLVDHLVRRYRVLVPDLPGNGGSGLPSGRSAPGLGIHIDAVRALIDHCGEPVHLVGHSFGAAVALATAVSARDNVASLTAIEPAAFHLLSQSGHA